jgi:hypothetical protein
LTSLLNKERIDSNLKVLGTKYPSKDAGAHLTMLTVTPATSLYTCQQFDAYVAIQ